MRLSAAKEDQTMTSKNTSKKASGARASKKDLPVRNSKRVKGGNLISTVLKDLSDVRTNIIGNTRG